MKKKRVIVLGIIAAIIIVISVIFLSSLNSAKKEETVKKLIKPMSYTECLDYFLKENPEAVVTIGMIKDDKAEWFVYGNGGEELPKELHDYEIGSNTKPITAAMIAKAVSEGLINTEDPINVYLDLPDGKTYPTVRQLLTHTSGYPSEFPTVSLYWNSLTGKNPTAGVTREFLLKKISKMDIGEEKYPFQYSNTGFALLGMILENVYGADYTSLANKFMEEIGMSDSHISDGEGDLGNLCDWGEDYAEIPAGAVISNIDDMLVYAQKQLDNEGIFETVHETLEVVNATSTNHAVDEIGMSWFKDTENGCIWHGGTSLHYRSYVGFCLETQTAVVVLSDIPMGGTHGPVEIGSRLLEEIQGVTGDGSD